MANIFSRKKKKDYKSNYVPSTSKSKKFKIVDLSPTRVTASIDDFIQAVDAASNPIRQYRLQLYVHYLQTLKFDPFVKGLIEKRLENLTNKELVAYRGDEPADDINEFCKSPQFIDFVKDILLQGKFFGMGVFEFDKEIWNGYELFKYKTLPIMHINPFEKEILQTPMDSKGTSFENLQDYLFVGNEEDLGLMLQVTLLSLYKRWGMVNYGKYMDLASENFAQLKVRDYGDEESLQNLQTQIDKRGAGGAARMPDNWNVEFDNQASSQQNTLFENFDEMIKDDLAIFILGQTMTTQDGSSRAQADVHLEEQKEKYNSDEQYVAHFLNYNFVDHLSYWGLNPAGVRWQFETSKIEGQTRKLRNYKHLKELGVEFTDEELRKEFDEIIKGEL